MKPSPPLLIATRREGILYLVLNENFELKTRNQWGAAPYSLKNSPLLLAAHGGFQDIVDLLLKHGAEVNQESKDILIVASACGHLAVVQRLVAAWPTGERTILTR